MANPAALVNQPPPTVTRKSITGFVTKLVGDGATYGFINDEIFFQQTNVADGPAGINDRVFAECEYSAHLPIKWNATSIKIVARASSSPGNAGHPGPASSILDSDPRRQSRQAMLLNQQQQQQPSPAQTQFASPNQQQQTAVTVANTYQQHRQQKQQQHMLPHQHDLNINQAAPQLLQQPMGPMDPGMNQAPNFFAPFGQAPPLGQHPGEMQSLETPMGPPKLEYTSQLGSAFVQNQFMPGPMISQPPPTTMLPQARPVPMLPQIRPQQHQPQQQQQQHPPTHQSRREQQRNQNNKNTFNNNDKNERNNQNNRGRTRNDKFDQPRNNNERENSNSRSSRAGSNSRDRSGCRGERDNNNKREGIINRPSPSRNSARSTTSVSSDRGNKSSSSRRHYEAQNIPRTTILTDMNSWNMRSRCPSSIHVPSDLKNIIVNPYLRLDIKNLPKPLSFKVEPTQLDVIQEAGEESDSEDAKKESATETSEKTANEESKPSSTIDSGGIEDSLQATSTKEETDNTPPSSKSDSKLNHKHGVKVVLISLLELESIYKKVFGPGLDSYSSDSKSHSRLDEAISMLCNKGSNGGHSLIGGKFDPTLDGFVEGETNEFERHNRQPDLIATCRRVVSEQTGLDLGPCQSWTLVSTFIYNHKCDYFSPKASIEYSYIYMPHIWSMQPSCDLDDSQIEKESLVVNVSSLPSQETAESGDATMTEENFDQTLPSEQESTESAVQGDAAVVVPQVTLENLHELKVADLKVELDKRGVIYEPKSKKADLVAALQANLAMGASGGDVSSSDNNVGETVNEHDHGIQNDQLEEGEVPASDENSPSNEVSELDGSPKATNESNVQSNKRKSQDVDETDAQQETKKIKEDDGGQREDDQSNNDSSATKKSERVQMVKEPFVVKARKGQQQLSVVPLYDVVQVSRYDQFELSVVSNILKEALVQHLSEYIFTTLVEDNLSRTNATTQSGDSASSASSTGTNSQESNIGDTNNNTSANKTASLKTQNQQATTDKLVKEYQVDRYINLAFAYFDSTHIGYMQADDLSKLFCNTGMTISKRALMSLIGESEKFNYRCLAELPPRVAPSYVYKFPEQFMRLPGSTGSSAGEDATRDDCGARVVSGKMVEFQGVKYDVERLIQQVREAETNRVNMIERYNHAIANFDKQADEIHVLEVSRMSLSKSIKSLHDELSELRRERDSSGKKMEILKTKLEEMLAELQKK